MFNQLKLSQKQLGLLGGGALALFSTLHFAAYFGRQELESSESDLLNRAVVYLQRYEDENIENVLDFTEEALERVAGGSLRIPELIGLQRELSEIQEAIQNSSMPFAYRSNLNRFGKRIEDVADKYERDDDPLVLGIIYGAAALWWFGLTYYSHLKERKITEYNGFKE